MKARTVRDIVFAHAIETAAPHESLPTAARCNAITQESLHALGKSGDGSTAFAAFLQERAKRIIANAQLPADIRALWLRSAGVSRWAVIGILAAALVLGYLGHAITDPHRVDLLSLSLVGIVLWNLLVYGLLIVGGLRALVRRKPEVLLPLAPTQAHAANAGEAARAPSGWLQKLAARRAQLTAGTGLRKLALTFERNWWQISRRQRHAQWLLCLHLGAAMLALGALASLWITGLTREYQVGWESTFLSPAAVQTCLNILFAPVHWLVGAPPWSLEEIRALQGWVPSGTPEVAAGLVQWLERPTVGERWVQLYTLLLCITVIGPRLLLALWQGVRLGWMKRHMALPLQQPYFQKLQRDWAGRATQLLVQPYSLDLTPEREAVLRNHVVQSYGAGAQLTLLPALAYGSPLPQALDGTGQQVLLLNLAATPEAEIHGALLGQVLHYWGAQTDVWLWAQDFRVRNTGAPGRVQEREHLWQDFVRRAGLHVTLIPAAGN